MTYNIKCSFSSFLASFAFAFFVDIKSINYILRAMLNINEESGFMSNLYLIVIFVLLLTSLLQNNNLFKINRYIIFIVLYILFWYQYTNAVIGAPRVSFLYLCVFTVMAFLTPSLVQIDVKTTLKYIMVLPVLGVFYTDRIFESYNKDFDTISMMVSYAFLVPVLANIVYYRKFFKEDTRKERVLFGVASISNLFYLYQLIARGSRGPILCVLSLVLFYIIVKKGNGLGVEIKKNKTLLIFTLFFFLSVFFIDILNFANSIFQTLGISLNVIDKNMRMIAEGDMSNGRDYIAGIALHKIAESPIFGYGLDQFENNTGMVYPHNFVLQILYDGGLLFFILLLVPVIYKLYKKFRYCDEDEYYILTFFFFISVPGALLSSDLWEIERLWIFFGVVFASNFIKKTYKARKTHIKR